MPYLGTNCAITIECSTCTYTSQDAKLLLR